MNQTNETNSLVTKKLNMTLPEKIINQQHTDVSLDQLQQMRDPEDITVEEYYTRSTTLEPPVTNLPYNVASFYHLPNHKHKSPIKEKCIF